jgi:hypothetical protein
MSPYGGPPRFKGSARRRRGGGDSFVEATLLQLQRDAVIAQGVEKAAGLLLAVSPLGHHMEQIQQINQSQSYIHTAVKLMAMADHNAEKGGHQILPLQPPITLTTGGNKMMDPTDSTTNDGQHPAQPEQVIGQAMGMPGSKPAPPQPVVGEAMGMPGSKPAPLQPVIGDAHTPSPAQQVAIADAYTPAPVGQVALGEAYAPNVVYQQAPDQPIPDEHPYANGESHDAGGEFHGSSLGATNMQANAQPHIKEEIIQPKSYWDFIKDAGKQMVDGIVFGGHGRHDEL